MALCRLLLSAPDLLLLDEPTNHLDAESVGWLERHLEEYKGTVVAVTHDRYFLDNVAGWILELDRGHGIPFQGNYSSWLEQKQVRLAQEDEDGQGAQAHDRVRARVGAREPQGPAQEVQGAPEQLRAPAGRGPQRQARPGPDPHPAGPAAGRQGHRRRDAAQGLRRPAADRRPLVHAPAGRHRRDHRRQRRRQDDAVPDDRRRRADRLRARSRSARRSTSPTSTRAATRSIPRRPSGRRSPTATSTSRSATSEVNSRAYVAGFNFKGSDQQRKVGALSGGERNRVHLAKLLRRGGNVLLLDEPTNDLDVDTLRALEEALLAFPGCAVIISHDRWFLDRVATHVLAFEGDSQVTWFEGNFEAYEENRHARLGAEADRPHRISYKKLVARVSVNGGAGPDPALHGPELPVRVLGRAAAAAAAVALRRADRVGAAHGRARPRSGPARTSRPSGCRGAAGGCSCCTGCRSTGGRSSSARRCPRAARSSPRACAAPEREAAMLRRLRVLNFAGAPLDDPEMIERAGTEALIEPEESRTWLAATRRSSRRCAPTWRPRARPSPASRAQDYKLGGPRRGAPLHVPVLRADPRHRAAGGLADREPRRPARLPARRGLRGGDRQPRAGAHPRAGSRTPSSRC